MTSMEDVTANLSPEEREHAEAVSRGVEEIMESLNGFDEIAVARAFGKELEDLGNLTTLRACVFTLLRRDGANDNEAKQRVMEMRAGDVQKRLAEFGGPGDIIPSDPASEEGKGDSERVETLRRLPLSS